MLRAQYETRGPVPQDVIHAVEFEAPKLEKGQVLLEVIAAPINPSDVLTLTGMYGQLPPLPAIGGGEGVGRVAELGPDTKGPALGQVVLLPAGCGSWSTHAGTHFAATMTSSSAASPCTHMPSWGSTGVPQRCRRAAGRSSRRPMQFARATTSSS